MQLLNFRWIAVLFILLKMNLALGDVTPSYVDIFSVPTTANLIECTEILKENSYCQLEVKSFDPQTGHPEAARKIKGLTVTGGEGYWYAPVYGQKKINAKEAYFQVPIEDGTRIWVRAPFSKLKSVEKALTDLASLVGESTYNFNPELKEVFLDKGGTSALAIKDVLKLSSIPNKRLGTVEISLDPAEARKSTSKKVLIFTFSGKGERRLTSSEILASKASSENRLNEKAKAIAAKDPFKIKLPVFRTEGASYLVQAVPLNAGDDDEGKGVIGDSVVVPNFYTWIKSDGVTLKYKAGEMDELPLFEIPYPDSPSLEFRMERGVNFQKSGAPWTSVKIYAMPLDFDALKQVDENGNEGYLSRKKTFLREIFFPVYNPQKHINFWLGWQPGC